MKFILAILALGFPPAFSYLASLERANAAAAQPPTFDAPTYFMDPVTPNQAASANESYLDGLVTTPTATTSGNGISGYLDALPNNSAGASGAGLNSYAETLNAAGSAPPSFLDNTPSTSSAPAAESFSFEGDGNVAASSTNYMDALASNSASSISGVGIASYLDALPSKLSLSGGAGISTYSDGIPSANIAVGGAGIQSHTDTLSPTSGGTKASYAPSSGSKPTFTMGSISGSFDFSFEAARTAVRSEHPPSLHWSASLLERNSRSRSVMRG